MRSRAGTIPRSPTTTVHWRSRGRRAGELIAAHLREQGIGPELVLCSSALRARQTFELVSQGFAVGAEPNLDIEAGLYAASSEDLLARLRTVPDGVGSVMLIGHQPAIQELALALVGAGPGLERLGAKFPTAALATFDLIGAWTELTRGSGRLVEMVRPKQLGGRSAD